jgi:hypothetical protein
MDDASFMDEDQGLTQSPTVVIVESIQYRYTVKALYSGSRRPSDGIGLLPL